MNYRDGLTPWAIFQHLPTGKNSLVYRFRTRTEAVGYMSILKQGGGEFEVVYDLPQSQEANVTDSNTLIPGQIKNITN